MDNGGQFDMRPAIHHDDAGSDGSLSDLKSLSSMIHAHTPSDGDGEDMQDRDSSGDFDDSLDRQADRSSRKDPGQRRRTRAQGKRDRRGAATRQRTAVSARVGARKVPRKDDFAMLLEQALFVQREPTREFIRTPMLTASPKDSFTSEFGPNAVDGTGITSAVSSNTISPPEKPQLPAIGHFTPVKRSRGRPGGSVNRKANGRHEPYARPPVASTASSWSGRNTKSVSAQTTRLLHGFGADDDVTIDTSVSPCDGTAFDLIAGSLSVDAAERAKWAADVAPQTVRSEQDADSFHRLDDHSSSSHRQGPSEYAGDQGTTSYEQSPSDPGARRGAPLDAMPNAASLRMLDESSRPAAQLSGKSSSRYTKEGQTEARQRQTAYLQTQGTASDSNNFWGMLFDDRGAHTPYLGPAPSHASGAPWGPPVSDPSAPTNAASRARQQHPLTGLELRGVYGLSKSSDQENRYELSFRPTIRWDNSGLALSSIQVALQSSRNGQHHDSTPVSQSTASALGDICFEGIMLSLEKMEYASRAPYSTLWNVSDECQTMTVGARKALLEDACRESAARVLGQYPARRARDARLPVVSAATYQRKTLLVLGDKEVDEKAAGRGQQVSGLSGF